MDIQKQINDYIFSQSTQKCIDMQELHRIILTIKPDCKLWFLDGKNEENKIVSNPNIGYGLCNINYKDGSKREFYQIGMSANTTGISIYFFGIKDRTFLFQNYGSRIGKANVTGYCIKFKKLNDINVEVFEELVRYVLL